LSQHFYSTCKHTIGWCVIGRNLVHRGNNIFLCCSNFLTVTVCFLILLTELYWIQNEFWLMFFFHLMIIWNLWLCPCCRLTRQRYNFFYHLKILKCSTTIEFKSIIEIPMGTSIPSSLNSVAEENEDLLFFHHLWQQTYLRVWFGWLAQIFCSFIVSSWRVYWCDSHAISTLIVNLKIAEVSNKREAIRHHQHWVKLYLYWVIKILVSFLCWCCCACWLNKWHKSILVVVAELNN
jgi:hypothetical protein